MKERQRRRRSKKRARQYRHSMLAVCAVLVFLVAALSVNAFQLRAKAQEYQIQETELAEQIEEEKGRAAQIDDLEAYVGRHFKSLDILETVIGTDRRFKEDLT